MAHATTTGQHAQTPVQAFTNAFDAMKQALAAIHREVQESPPERPFSGDSYLPEQLRQQAQAALKLAESLREPVPVKTQRTITTVLPDFPFATTTRTVRGAWVRDDFFCVEPTDDLHDTTGIEVFRTLMQLLKQDKPEHHLLARDVIQAAALKMDEPARGRTTRWIAHRFANLVDLAMKFAAKNSDWDAYLDREIEDLAKYKARYEKQERDHMAMMTARSIEARKARKLKATC